MFNLSRMTEIFTIMIIVAVVLAVLLVILFIVEQILRRLVRRKNHTADSQAVDSVSAIEKNENLSGDTPEHDGGKNNDG
ncbi:MAG: hypothetical protein GX276_02080 [Clostridiaceae bacterium]|nr:hypothetical protein [Clostridiaceae bacterium]